MSYNGKGVISERRPCEATRLGPRSACHERSQTGDGKMNSRRNVSMENATVSGWQREPLSLLPDVAVADYGEAELSLTGLFAESLEH